MSSFEISLSQSLLNLCFLRTNLASLTLFFCPKLKQDDLLCCCHQLKAALICVACKLYLTWRHLLGCTFQKNFFGTAAQFLPCTVTAQSKSFFSSSVQNCISTISPSSPSISALHLANHPPSRLSSHLCLWCKKHMYVTTQERERERKETVHREEVEFSSCVLERRSAEAANLPDVTAAHAAGAELLSNTAMPPLERAKSN